MQQIGIGIIGLGMAAKPHALALRDLGTRVRVLGGYSPTPERRREFEQTYALPAVDSLEALLGDEQWHHRRSGDRVQLWFGDLQEVSRDEEVESEAAASSPSRIRA